MCKAGDYSVGSIAVQPWLEAASGEGLPILVSPSPCTSARVLLAGKTEPGLQF